jgi:hypothetical protein
MILAGGGGGGGGGGEEEEEEEVLLGLCVIVVSLAFLFAKAVVFDGC